MNTYRNGLATAVSPSRFGRAARLPTAGPTFERNEPDLPPLSEDDQRELQSFKSRQQVLADVTLGCIKGNHSGAYFFGPPGVSKTYTINNTLRQQKANWKLHQRITAKPLYLELEKNPDAVHVIDDCEQLFSEKSALTLLRSALGGERINGRRERLVAFSVAGAKARVLEHYFYGAIIFTSNRPFSDEKPEVRAVMSRIMPMAFAPTDREIRAVMRNVARQGYRGECGSMTAHECVEVVEFVIDLAGSRQYRLDLRWIEHGYGHYLTQVHGGKVDWRNMVKCHMMNTLTYFDYPIPDRSGNPAGQSPPAMAEQIVIAREIEAMPDKSATERTSIWEERTGQSRATYYRRLQDSRSGQATCAGSLTSH